MFTILPSCPIFVVRHSGGAFFCCHKLERHDNDLLTRQIDLFFFIDIRRNARWLLRPTALGNDLLKQDIDLFLED
jgi:hypothetical protein